LKGEVLFKSTISDCVLISLLGSVSNTNTLISHTDNEYIPKSTIISNTSDSSPGVLKKDLFRAVSRPVLKGRSVLITGYGFQDPYKTNRATSDKDTDSYTPLITRGHVMKTVYSGDEMVMVVTTAVLLPGMSGGLVVDELTNLPLAMAISNSV